MIIAIYKYRNQIFIKKNLKGNEVILQDIRCKDSIVMYPKRAYDRDFVEWELIKGGK